MKVTREKTENCQAFLTVEMEAAEVEESVEVAYSHLAGKANIPGFRKGKAPRAILERHISKEGVLDEALTHLIPKAYEDAVKEQGIEAFAQPHIEITGTDPAVTFKAIVPLPPEIEPGDYHGIKIEPEPVETTEDNIDSVIEELRHQYSTWEPVERSAAFGDLLSLDVESEVEGKPFINQQGAQYQIIRDSPSPVPGFAGQLVGMDKGQDKEFRLKFPDDYSRNELAGKEASFKVKVAEIKEEKLPELNDEFAKRIGPDFDTLDALREEVSTNLKQRAEEKSKLDFEVRVVEAVVDLARVEFPPVLTEMEIDQMINERTRYLQMDGKGMEEYLKTINKTEEELREELRPSAVKRVTTSLVMGKLAEEEKIEVAESEVDAEVENMIKSAAEKNKDELQKFLNGLRSRESIRQHLMTRKTVDRLAEIARGGVDASVDVAGDSNQSS